ncbi:MAG: single-stranded DNA-binding protein [Bacilli bacterium]|nr:single-stranded DNA-binding protein [Bacilli bacterium]
MNKVILKGVITRDIDLRHTKSDVVVARFTVATKRTTANKDGKYENDYISCVAYQHNAEMINKYFSKGSGIMVEGHIQTGSYEKDGKKIYTTDVVVERVEFVDKLEQKIENKTDSEIIASVVNEEQYQLPF